MPSLSINNRSISNLVCSIRRAFIDLILPVEFLAKNIIHWVYSKSKYFARIIISRIYKTNKILLNFQDLANRPFNTLDWVYWWLSNKWLYTLILSLFPLSPMTIWTRFISCLRSWDGKNWFLKVKFFPLDVSGLFGYVGKIVWWKYYEFFDY